MAAIMAVPDKICPARTIPEATGNNGRRCSWSTARRREKQDHRQTVQIASGRIVVLGQAARQEAFTGRVKSLWLSPEYTLKNERNRSAPTFPGRHVLAGKIGRGAKTLPYDAPGCRYRVRRVWPRWLCVRLPPGEFRGAARHPRSGAFPRLSRESPAPPEACVHAGPRQQR